jgi:hypothetical protein
MGGLVIRIKDFEETIEWNAHSAVVAEFINLGSHDSPIKMTRLGGGDNHDGDITFDPDQRQIIINTDYFWLSKRAIKFWRAIGFDIVLKNTELMKR